MQIENSQLKVSMLQSEFAADSGSELKFQWCLQRRGIAFDQRYLLSWAVHEQLVSTLLGWLSRTPPPGFQHVKLEQLVRADRELWTVLARETRGSLKATPAGVLPLDARVTALLSDPRITMLLLPLPVSHKAPIDKTSDASVNDKKQSDPDRPKKVRKTRAEKACPEELKKYDMKLDNGRICWSYNLKDGCKAKTSGKPPKCQRGIHVCANCKKPGHSVLVCRPYRMHEGAQLLGRVKVMITLRVNLQLHWSQQGVSANAMFHLDLKMMFKCNQIRHQRKLKVACFLIQELQQDIK